MVAFWQRFQGAIIPVEYTYLENISLFFLGGGLCFPSVSHRGTHEGEPHGCCVQFVILTIFIRLSSCSLGECSYTGEQCCDVRSFQTS